jgi:hypothetical protein
MDDHAVGFAQFLSHRRLLPPGRDVVRAQAMHQFVHQDVGEERIERHMGTV